MTVRGQEPGHPSNPRRTRDLVSGAGGRALGGRSQGVLPPPAGSGNRAGCVDASLTWEGQAGNVVCTSDPGAAEGSRNIRGMGKDTDSRCWTSGKPAQPQATGDRARAPGPHSATCPPLDPTLPRRSFLMRIRGLNGEDETDKVTHGRQRVCEGHLGPLEATPQGHALWGHRALSRKDSQAAGVRLRACLCGFSPMGPRRQCSGSVPTGI